MDSEDLKRIGIIYPYLVHSIKNQMGESLNHYMFGLAFLAKFDMFIPSLFNACEEFYLALKKGLSIKDKIDLDIDPEKFFVKYLSEKNFSEDFIPIFNKVKNFLLTRNANVKFTKDDVIKIKICYDVFFYKTAHDYFLREIKK